MLTREEAWDLLGDWTKTDSLRNHARAVEIVMRQAWPLGPHARR
jgi:predicted hydrolase (HD superfamily)